MGRLVGNLTDTTNSEAAMDDRLYVERAWQSYLDRDAAADSTVPPLPDSQVDLAPFTRDIIPGERGKVWMGRAKDLVDHFAGIEPEFRGTPRIAHLTACTIVYLRRDPGSATARALFWRLLTECGPVLTEVLNSRWLTSICDTVIDIADRDVDRAAALVGTLFINTLKLAETERRLYLPQRPWPPQTRLRAGGEIYDGVQPVYTVTHGDLDNLFDRIARGLQIDSPVVPIVQQLIYRAIEGDNVVNRIISLKGQEKRPLAPQDTLEALSKIMRGV